jgi:hypothetical protein
MISNRVYRAKKEIELLERMVIKSGQELEIVMDVVYVNGNMGHQTYRTYFIVILLIIQHHLMMLLKNGKWKILKYLTQ